MTTRNASPIAAFSPHWLSVALAGLFVLGWSALGATGARAQVQIDQVEPVASEIEGATQGQVVLSLPGENCGPSDAPCEGVDRSDLLDLIPVGTPPLQGSGSGNSTVVVQRGDDNDATVSQQGSGNETSVSQLGNTNETSVTQGPVGRHDGSISGLPRVSPGVDGTSNLAVSVHSGHANTTTIRQFGADNTAGIRLDGSDNAVGLLQIGQGNDYLLDHTGSGLDLTGSNRIEQIGNQNTLVQEGGGTPINVQMRGDGIRMFIRQNGGL